MPHKPSRRSVAAGLAGLAAAAATLARPAAAVEDALAALERTHGGRLGVGALDTGSGRVLGHRAGERFVMCSSFKVLAVAAVLARADAGRESLTRLVRYSPAELLDYAPVTRAHVAEGGMRVEGLCAAAVEVSDNTAANLLLASLGGPAGVTGFLRGLGDPVTRLDRVEPALNVPSGDLDTTTPTAILPTLRKILLGDALSPASRARLEGWMVAATPGLKRLRAGLPAGWRAGDKSGTYGPLTNDVAIIRPPNRAPLLAAAYYDAPLLDGPGREAVLREVGAIVAAWAG